MIRSSVIAMTAAVVLAGLAVPAAAQSATAPSTMCANGYRSWANSAFTNGHQAGFLCIPAASKGKAAGAASAATAQQRREAAIQQQKAAAARKQAAQQRALQKSQVAATRETDAPAESGTSAAAAPSTTAKAPDGSKPLCRRYLASTGQTVEVPCT